MSPGEGSAEGQLFLQARSLVKSATCQDLFFNVRLCFRLR